MVRHQHKRPELVQSADPFAIPDGLHDGIGNLRPQEPQRAQHSQPEREEQLRPVGMKVREIAPVFQSTQCPRPLYFLRGTGFSLCVVCGTGFSLCVCGTGFSLCVCGTGFSL